MTTCSTAVVVTPGVTIAVSVPGPPLTWAWTVGLSPAYLRTASVSVSLSGPPASPARTMPLLPVF
jgi:hypothetical protein